MTSQNMYQCSDKQVGQPVSLAIKQVWPHFVVFFFSPGGSWALNTCITESEHFTKAGSLQSKASNTLKDSSIHTKQC